VLKAGTQTEGDGGAGLGRAAAGEGAARGLCVVELNLRPVEEAEAEAAPGNTHGHSHDCRRAPVEPRGSHAVRAPGEREDAARERGDEVEREGEVGGDKVGELGE